MASNAVTTKGDSQIILRTKLRRPRGTGDLVRRPRLEQALDDGLNYPLTLVAAPTGFGKSTLVSTWLKSCSLPHAWISFDEADNDLGVFLAYLLGAMQSLFPDALPETRAFLTGMRLPIVSVIASKLINELDEIGRDFILVLDDYHVIREHPIHELVSLLLQYPPQGMHLVIVTRLEPQLSLGLLRARNQVTEIRAQDLRFSLAEIAEFATQTLAAPLTEKTLAVLAEKTEGWAAGLRFAALTLRRRGDLDSQLAGLHAENRHVLDYLMSEVLAKVPPSIRRFLLKTSILDRVCSSLGEEVLGSDDPEGKPQAYLVWLERAAMFTVALDERGEWYRYHHLFQELLRDELARETSTGEIAMLHARASRWYARHGLVEEALQHALLSDDTPAVVRLLAEHRHDLMDSELWQLHHRTLRKLPEEMVAADPDLTLMAAWTARVEQSDLARVLELVNRAERLVAQMVDQPEHAVALHGEIDTLRAAMICEGATDPASAIALARRGLATTPRSWYYVRSTAWLWLAIAYQMAGRLDQAYATLAQGEPEDVAENGAVRARVRECRLFVEWIAGDLLAMPALAAQALAVAEAHQLRESLGWAHYFLSSIAYQRNDLNVAEAHALVLEEQRYACRPMAYVQSALIYASIFQARGRPDQARQKLALAFDFVRETQSGDVLPLVQAFEAELAARQGDLGAARYWSATTGPSLRPGLMPFFYAPQLALPKILLAQATPASREQAAAVLSRLHAFVIAAHNTRFTIEVLALQALLHAAQGDERAALALLRQALELAQPGGYIRLFVDLGPQLARLLTASQQTGGDLGYTGQILRAFAASAPAAPPRETPVYPISPLTVKRHATNIYGKLQVSGRREAVAKAIRLGLL